MLRAAAKAEDRQFRTAKAQPSLCSSVTTQANPVACPATIPDGPHELERLCQRQPGSLYGDTVPGGEPPDKLVADASRIILAPIANE